MWVRRCDGEKFVAVSTWRPQDPASQPATYEAHFAATMRACALDRRSACVTCVACGDEPAGPHTAVPLDTYLRFVAQNYYGGTEDGSSDAQVRGSVARRPLPPTCRVVIHCCPPAPPLPSPRQFQVFRRSMLGQLVSPLRRPQVIGTLHAQLHVQLCSCVGICQYSPRCLLPRAGACDTCSAHRLAWREHPTDKWSPLEIARFEAAMCMYGKVFHLVQRAVRSEVASSKRPVPVSRALH